MLELHGVPFWVVICIINAHLSQEWQTVGVRQLRLTIPDLVAAPSTDQLTNGVSFLLDHRQNKGSVYVHCKAGRSRSATLVACYLMKVSYWLEWYLMLGAGLFASYFKHKAAFENASLRKVGKHLDHYLPDSKILILPGTSAKSSGGCFRHQKEETTYHHQTKSVGCSVYVLQRTFIARIPHWCVGS